MSAARVRLGMLTPSSNTTLEPVTAAMLAGAPGISAHFGRFRVTEIALTGQATGQFDEAPMLAAAGLLADARVHAVCWNGTSAGWLGLDRDRRLCEAIERATGVPGCSAVLGLVELLRARGARRLGLVSPYTAEVQAAIVDNFAREGIEVVAERHCGIRANFEFAGVGPAQTEAMIRQVARAAPDAITVLCTNMDGASLAERLEAELGIVLLDTIATALWASLRAAGVPASCIAGWGRLFREHP